MLRIMARALTSPPSERSPVVSLGRMRAPTAFDSVVLTAVLRDLRASLGARVRAVHQPSPTEIALELRRTVLERLLISVDARWARLHLAPSVAPGDPGPFAQMLRARLTGARLEAVVQPPFERTVTLRFEADTGPCDLVAEIMGRHSNLILVRDGTIAGALKLVTGAQSSVRAILPGRRYTAAPQDRRPPGEWSPDALAAFLSGSDAPIAQALIGAVLGLSPVMAREVCVRAGMNPDIPAGRAADAGRLQDSLLDLERVVR